jgi:DNA-binding NarL/FixJ family response regulator
MFNYDEFLTKSTELLRKTDENGQRFYSEAQVALKMGTTVLGLREIRRKALVKRQEKVKELFEAGKSVKEIATEMNLNESSIRGFLKVS